MSRRNKGTLKCHFNNKKARRKAKIRARVKGRIKAKKLKVLSQLKSVEKAKSKLRKLMKSKGVVAVLSYNELEQFLVKKFNKYEYHHSESYFIDNKRITWEVIEDRQGEFHEFYFDITAFYDELLEEIIFSAEEEELFSGELAWMKGFL